MDLGSLIGGEGLRSWLEGSSVSGFVAIIVKLLMICSFIMISLGTIGEYVGKIYDETKDRPAFDIRASVGSRPSFWQTAEIAIEFGQVQSGSEPWDTHCAAASITRTPTI